MNRYLIIFVLAFVFIGNVSAQGVKKVAVLNTAGNLTESINTMIREEINNNVIRSEGYVAVERNLINNAVVNNNYPITGQIDLEKTRELGVVMGAHLICHTTATTLGSNYYISCKIIEVSTGRIIDENTGMTKEGLSDLFQVVSILGKGFFPNEYSASNTTTTPAPVKQPVVQEKPVQQPVVKTEPIQQPVVNSKSYETNSNLPSINFMGSKLVVMPNDVIAYKVTWMEANIGCANSNAHNYDDWRLPTKEEISQMYLNKAAISNVKPYWYWSSTKRGSEYYRQAFDAEKLALANPNARMHVRCVRNEHSSSNSNIPTVDCQGKEVFVMPFDITEDKLTWNEASSLCSNASDFGFKDWRLPTKDEISVLYMNKALIGKTKPYWYWSSTSKGAEYYRQAFDADKLALAGSNARLHARCVRSSSKSIKKTIPTINVSGTEIFVMPSDVVNEKLTWKEANSTCLNANIYGYSDWRLPSYEEITQMYINRQNIQEIVPYWYWSSTTNGETYYKQAFDAQKIEAAQENDIAQVRCVRSNVQGIKTNENIAEFHFNGKQEFVMPHDISEILIWEQANSSCESLVYKGYNDWYLPSIDELEVLYKNKLKYKMYGKAYWSSSKKKDVYYDISFKNGKASGTTIGNKKSVRCVRKN